MFVGVPFFTATFTLFEYQAITVAAFVSGSAKLPSSREMRVEYNTPVSEKGYGKHFHSLRNLEEFYVQELLDWINTGIVAQGLAPIKGHSKDWIQAKQEQRERVKALFDADVKDYANTAPLSKFIQLCS
jgi:MFS transporter, ACS family, pantothenate transporter